MAGMVNISLDVRSLDNFISTVGYDYLNIETWIIIQLVSYNIRTCGNSFFMYFFSFSLKLIAYIIRTSMLTVSWLDQVCVSYVVPSCVTRSSRLQVKFKDCLPNVGGIVIDCKPQLLETKSKCLLLHAINPSVLLMQTLPVYICV